MVRKKKKNKRRDNKASVMVDAVTVVPITFVCISWFSFVLASTASIEHQCEIASKQNMLSVSQG